MDIGIKIVKVIDIPLPEPAIKTDWPKPQKEPVKIPQKVEEPAEVE